MGPNIGPLPIQNEQKLPKMVYIIPNSLVLHFGEDFMKIRTKKAKLHVFIYIFYANFHEFYEGQLKQVRISNDKASNLPKRDVRFILLK